jgi:signal transduction histidine kinase
VFPLVAEQAGRLVGADGCTLLRFLPGDQALIISNWSDIETAGMTPEGRVLPISGGPAMAAMFRSGRPERADQRPEEGGRPNPTGRDEAIRSAVSAPITVTGGMWGALVAWRITLEPLPSDTERRLGAFASLVGTAIANADARTALAASRKRIVAAADAARRQLERNLHDGAQQRFVSLSLALRLTLTQLETAPEAAADHLRTALEELSVGLEELRELARGIHPAILTDRGLGPAVDSLVTRSPVPVDVVEVPDERLPPEVEAAAYYVVAEALTNVARYAEASRATVAVSLRDGVVQVEVSDDGKGGADAGGGSGLRGLADRVEAIGGRLEVESPPGAGTRILAVTPCSSGPASEAAR